MYYWEQYDGKGLLTTNFRFIATHHRWKPSGWPKEENGSGIAVRDPCPTYQVNIPIIAPTAAEAVAIGTITITIVNHLSGEGAEMVSRPQPFWLRLVEPAQLPRLSSSPSNAIAPLQSIKSSLWITKALRSSSIVRYCSPFKLNWFSHWANRAFYIL